MSKEIKIEAIINKKCSEVWDLWNKPEHIIKWNFASDDWHCPKAENDLRAGGNLRARMEVSDLILGVLTMKLSMIQKFHIICLTEDM